MMETMPFQVEFFDGGITDNYIDGPTNKFRFGDNFFININRKLYTRPGSDLQDIDNPQIPVGAQRISFLYELKEQLFEFSGKRIYFKNPTYNTLLGPSGNDPFNLGDVNSLISAAELNDQVLLANSDYSNPSKIYVDNLGVPQVRTAGLPSLASDPVVTPAAGVNAYLYGFSYSITYQVGNKTFIDEGPITLVQISSADAPDSSTINISAIPVLANGASLNYDTTNIKINIYRSEANEDVLYFLAEISNGTTVYADSTSDASIILNPTAYTTDGTLDAEAPPACKYVHATNGFGYYANLKINGEVYNNVVQQSFLDDLDSTNSQFRVEVDSEITGLSSFEFTPIVLCKKGIFRLDGFFGNDGSGGIAKQKINDTVGCISNNSIVRTKIGTFFAGNDGFYWTDGFVVTKLNYDWSKRYKSFAVNTPERIYGSFDEGRNLVYWAVKENSSSADNDVIYVLHLDFGIRSDSCFTTWKGVENFAPSSLIVLEDGSFLRADRRGYIFKHAEEYYTDKRVDTLSAASTWEEAAIIYNYESCAYSFGTTFLRKWVTRVNIIAESETNLSLQINSINDDGRKVSSLKPITFNNAVIWGDADVVWGDSSIIWNYDGLIDEWRRFPAKGIRCNYKQLVLTNAYVLIESSDTNGLVTVNNIAKTATLNDSAIADFNSKATDYYISFSSDNYTKEYLITSRTDDTVVYADASNSSPAGSYAYKINGYPKGHILNLVNYNIHHAILGKTQMPYKGA